MSITNMSIDFATDSVIQSSLRNELGGDVTLITIAHRLQTIMDSDKIVSIRNCDAMFHFLIYLSSWSLMLVEL